MRTTVTLDPDVKALLDCAVRERGISFKAALNEAVRRGLAYRRSPSTCRFVQKTYAMGAQQYFRWDKALSTAEAMDDEELSKKRSLRCARA
ncbi:MAG: antitoxin [Candidatus Solibacter usitatus]|nr:antitoxin [Candidatus Solibacter usitatus]